MDKFASFLFSLTRLTFKRKLMAYSLLMSILPVLLLGTVSSIIATRSIQEEVNRNHMTLLKQVETMLNQFIASLQISSIAIASDLSVVRSVQVGMDLDHLEETNRMREAIRQQRSFSTVPFSVTLLYRKHHTYYTDLDENAPKLIASIVEQSAPKYNTAFMVPPNTYPNQHELLLIRPVPLLSNYTDGILALHVSTWELSKFLDKLNLTDGSLVFIVDNSGRIVISKNVEEIGGKLASTTELYQFWKNPESHSHQFRLKGVDYQLSAQKSSIQDWTFIALTPKRELTKKSAYIRYMTWSLVALLTVVWMLISYLGSKRLYGPIERLVTRFSPQDGRTRKRDDELKELDSFLQTMVSTNDRLVRQMNEHAPYIRESVSHMLLLGQASGNDSHKKIIEQFNLPLASSWFYVAVVSIDHYARFLQAYGEKDRSLIHYALRKMMEEICGETLPCVGCTPQPGQVAVIIGTDRNDADTERTVREIADRFRACVRRYYSFTVSVSVSRARQTHAGINACYQEALRLLNNRMLLGHDVTITDRTVEPNVRQSSARIVELQKQIVQNVVLGKLEEANSQLEDLVQEIPRYARSSETVLGCFSYLIGEFEYLLQKMECALDEWFEPDLYEQLYRMTSLGELKDWLQGTVFPTIRARIEQRRIPQQKRLVQQVLQHIRNHYDRDLSLQSVADLFRTSPFTLSRAFKEETGMNFGEYVTHFRMELAKEWLKETDRPIKDIAEQLCYSSTQNFSRIFKQLTGLPPGEYRRQFRDNEAEPSSPE